MSRGMITTIDLIKVRFERRVRWHRAEKSLGLQIKSLCRRAVDGDDDKTDELYKTVMAIKERDIPARLRDKKLDPALREVLVDAEPLLISYRIIAAQRLALEKQIELSVIELPIYRFALSIPGFAAGSLAAIIGSTGNLWNYATVQKVWKRMGMAVMDDGLRQRRRRGADDNKEYNPSRRSVMWTIGTTLLMSQSAKIDKDTGEVKQEPGDYRKIFDNRRAYEDGKNANGDYAEVAAKMLAITNFGKKTVSYKEYAAGRLPKAHLKARAQRYMEKQLLKRLWVEWRRCMEDAKPKTVNP